MIEITATVESFDQAEELLKSGVDRLCFGEETFGLRLPASFSRAEQEQLVKLAHKYGKKAVAVVNGIMHPERMTLLPEYLDFLAGIDVDEVVAGDAGVIYLLRQSYPTLPFIYDGETLVTNSRQINFWGKRGAVGAVLAREVPFDEMEKIAEHLEIPVETLVYGATCIHQSKRPLLDNYYQYVDLNERGDKNRALFLAEPQDSSSHYSIYEDSHGTHVFANNDVNLIKELPRLLEHDYHIWKLDGLFTPGEAFVEIVRVFLEAKVLLEEGSWSEEAAQGLAERIRQLHPKNRGLDTGFFYVDSKKIK